MTGPARLLGIRLQGFKSFAERTVVEFGAGISAVVGPNGSGKSNLADALRWSLGEQGRALRLRKAEDVIFAGSERRAALGMADVTLVLDNSDALLPVEFSVIEVGRRLYRSGENEYLLNRQRIRLRDLVDLLDGANLADNAFLFIGQGMVDQALALRPEERLPLFEEAAGVRRHERRRRKAEEQLAESEANLARVDDILAELRPQARRLAAQAEQQASREATGRELAEALLAAAHARWHEAAARVSAAERRRASAAQEADRAMAALQAAEEAVTSVTASLGTRAALERERRAEHEQVRERLTELRLREARLVGELEGIERDRGRLAAERASAEEDLAAQRRLLAQPLPPRDLELETAASEAERALADALAELAELRASTRARGEQLAALRRAEAAREAEVDTARRRLAEAERRAAQESERIAELATRRTEAQGAQTAAAERLREAASAEAAASARRESVRAELEGIEVRGAAATRDAAAAESGLAAVTGRLEALRGRLREEESRGIAPAARKRGGRRVDEDLVVDPALRAAVEAALADAARGYVVPIEVVPELAAERGVLVVNPPSEAGGSREDAAVRRMLAEVESVGGGVLVDAIERDPTGAARQLLERTVWAPDLRACLACRDLLPAGWVVVSRDGRAVVSGARIQLGRTDTPLERREEIARLEVEADRLATSAREARATATELANAAAAARTAQQEARADEVASAAARRRAEEEERVAARALENLTREAAWHEAQSARLASELERLRAAVAAMEPAAPGNRDANAADEADDSPVRAWEARVAELRARRDRVASDLAAVDRVRRDAEARQARALAAVSMDEERLARADRESATLADRERGCRVELDGLGRELATAVVEEERRRASLDELGRADAADRERLAAAERGALEARDRLRATDERLRGAEREGLEARVHLDALREQLVVELAGLGELGLAVLEAAAGTDADARNLAPDASAGAGLDEAALGREAAALESALDLAAQAWAAAPPATPPPAPGRLATLRRRYHELGAANPFAVEEHEAIRHRLEVLEGQQADLRQAIVRTRQLIDELTAMITEQFTSTFRALEVAFDQRFRQLFGGGFARLALTDPSDLSSTGVEIVARPPGKKAQALGMLSGGERALTAVALLFAMLEVRPVPFCVLDEVDAALDEANVGRFVEALRGLADRTQFIVITHNRGTIEGADALYGVTAGDDSASRVVSLRLDEARAIAERRTGDQRIESTAG